MRRARHLCEGGLSVRLRRGRLGLGLRGDFDALLAREDAAEHGRAARLNPLERALAHAVGREHEPFGDPLLQRQEVCLIDAFVRLDLPDFVLGFHPSPP
jgi:hypothetical protein